ncbi:hypothetical protein V4R08_01610 [Nitrobacter sp. NHB1]|uniref:hypothetical protein n=1 Tax=Nitrobacter sp. NHB1 TaxID=3119830 RepID=UPI002FFE2B3D
MSTFSDRCRLAAMLAMLCLSWSAANAQGEPVKYWVPFGPFGGGATEAANAETYSGFPSFDAGHATKSGFSFRSYSAPLSSWAGGFGWNGLNGMGAFGTPGSLSQESTQVGYHFRGMGGLPVTVFGGVDTLKYNPDVFSTVTSFNSNTGTAPAYGIHTGVEIRPTSNLSLSFSAGYTQRQSGLADTDIQSSLLPRELGGGR